MTTSGRTVTVTLEWSNEHGMCADCGDLPANYLAPDLTFTDVTDPANPVVRRGQKLCPICAALWASHGERLERLWKDEEEDAPERCGEGPHGEPCNRIIEFGQCPVHGEVGPGAAAEAYDRELRGEGVIIGWQDSKEEA